MYTNSSLRMQVFLYVLPKTQREKYTKNWIDKKYIVQGTGLAACSSSFQCSRKLFIAKGLSQAQIQGIYWKPDSGHYKL